MDIALRETRVPDPAILRPSFRHPIPLPRTPSHVEHPLIGPALEQLGLSP